MTRTPLENLIRERCIELDLTPVALVRRLGYSNTAKGLRRLEELYNGDLRSDLIVQRLPDALELPWDAIDKAVHDTQRDKLQAEEDAYRRNFRPHAIIMTERTVPNPMHIALLLGIEGLLSIDLDETRGRSSFIHQAINQFNDRVRRWGGVVPCFGKPTGVAVNYTPERAMRFDLGGELIGIIAPAVRLPAATLAVGNKNLSRSVASMHGSDRGGLIWEL